MPDDPDITYTVDVDLSPARESIAALFRDLTVGFASAAETVQPDDDGEGDEPLIRPSDIIKDRI